MSETWTRETCPHCRTKNWLCHGDMSDMTVVDTEACKCHKCKKIFPIGDLEEEDLHETEPFWQSGKENPND